MKNTRERENSKLSFEFSFTSLLLQVVHVLLHTTVDWWPVKIVENFSNVSKSS